MLLEVSVGVEGARKFLESAAIVLAMHLLAIKRHLLRLRLQLVQFVYSFVDTSSNRMHLVTDSLIHECLRTLIYHFGQLLYYDLNGLFKPLSQLAIDMLIILQKRLLSSRSDAIS